MIPSFSTILESCLGAIQHRWMIKNIKDEYAICSHEKLSEVNSFMLLKITTQLPGMAMKMKYRKVISRIHDSLPSLSVKNDDLSSTKPPCMLLTVV